jgi:hypothetical protein
MLSGETAGGKFPNEAVEHMAACCVEAEAIVPCDALAAALRGATLATFGMSGAESVACSAVRTAADVGAKMIISLAATGRTTQLIAKVCGVCVCGVWCRRRRRRHIVEVCVVFDVLVVLVLVVVVSSRCALFDVLVVLVVVTSSAPRESEPCLARASGRPLRAQSDDETPQHPTRTARLTLVSGLSPLVVHFASLRSTGRSRRS